MTTTENTITGGEIQSAPHDELIATIKALTHSLRTFREVPKDEQEWTSFDSEALEAGFDLLEKLNRHE